MTRNYFDPASSFLGKSQHTRLFLKKTCDSHPPTFNKQAVFFINVFDITKKIFGKKDLQYTK
jgi:hypothetical protein